MIGQRIWPVATVIVWLCFAVESKAQAIFDAARLHEVRIYTNASQQQTWFSQLQTYYDVSLNGEPQQYLRVNAVLDGEEVQQVGFRFKGKYSNYGFPGVKKPFCLDFNRFNNDGIFQGLKRLNLHNNAADPSFLREYMAYALFAHLHIPAPRASYAKLYINNAYWGCYTLVEEPDKTFLANRFGNKNGNLFECISDTDLDWRGSEKTAYPELELKTTEQPESWNKLLAWIELFNRPTGYDYQQRLSAVFDTETFLKILAVDVLINNWDSYYDNGRNFLIYDDLQYGKLRWIPWDYNLAFWNSNPHAIPQDGSDDGYKPLILSILNHPYLRTHYLETYCRLIEYELNSFAFDTYAADAQNLIAQAVEEDSLKFYSTEAFYANRTEGVTVNMLRNNIPTDVYLPGVATLYRRRKNDLRNLLFTEGVDCSELSAMDERLHCKLFPNPAHETFTIYVEENYASQASVEVVIYNLEGKPVLQQKQFTMLGSVTCPVDALAPGVYVVQVTVDGHSNRQKIIIH